MDNMTILKNSQPRIRSSGLILQNFVRNFVDLIYPKNCCVCGQGLPRAAIDDIVCLSCWSKIRLNRPPFCHVCGRQMAQRDLCKNVCSRCVRENHAFDRAFSVCVYEDVIKSLIHSFKYKDKEYLGKPLSRLIVDFINEYDIPAGYMDYLIPVPLHRTKLREREYNQAQILCAGVAAALNKPMMDNNLFRYRATDTQTAQEPHQRFTNVKGSFAVTEKNAVLDKNILLIDDVLTTGATASEAARALKSAGANIVFVLTLAG